MINNIFFYLDKTEIYRYIKIKKRKGMYIMSKLFGKNNQSNPMTKRELYERNYNNGITNLLLVVAFSVINIVLLVTNADTYFLFSAFIPYFIASMGMLMCGRFPDDYYTGEFEGMTFLDGSLFPIFLVISIAITLLYLIAWIMSNKNRVGWLIFALVLFGLDMMLMLLLNGIAVESILDIIFHILIIYGLITGISAHYKLKALPPEEEAVFPNDNIPQGVQNEDGASEPATPQMPNTPIIREADKYVKNRVLLETSMLNYEICYRRVKHTNELVINGNVYDEITGIIEHPHILTAWIDGHCIEAGYTGTHSVIYFDGETVAQKLRLI